MRLQSISSPMYTVDVNEEGEGYVLTNIDKPGYYRPGSKIKLIAPDNRSCWRLIDFNHYLTQVELCTE